MKDKKHIVLLSGLDSLISWYFLRIEHGIVAPCLYVDLGTQFSKKERAGVVEVAERIPDMTLTVHAQTQYGSNWETKDENAHLPFRNFFLAMIATNMGADYIWLTAQKGELDRVDKRPEVLENFSKNVLSLEAGRKVVLISPFFEWTKQTMVEWYANEGLPTQDLIDIPGCYGSESDPYCGACKCCARKFVALEYAGINTADAIPSSIITWPGWKQYIEDMKAGKYDEQRTSETFEVLKRMGIMPWKEE